MCACFVLGLGLWRRILDVCVYAVVFMCERLHVRDAGVVG